MIWREKPIYMVSHNNCSNTFHLPHPFHWRRPKKFTMVIIIFPSQGLGPAEGSWGLCYYTHAGKGSTERSMQKSQRSKVSIKANCLGSKAIGKSQCIENQFSKGLIYIQLSDKSWTHSKKTGHCHSTILPPGCGQKEQIQGDKQGRVMGQKTGSEDGENRERGWGISGKPERDCTALARESPLLPDRATRKQRKDILSGSMNWSSGQSIIQQRALI